MSNIERCHFLGINGSGIVGVACLAKEKGYIVDGCDINQTSDYSKQLSDLNIEVKIGQSETHLKDIDKLIVSPAVFFRDKYKNIKEIIEAMEKNITVLRWQQFIDKYLANDKDLICICGTHGKTTTTTILSNILEYCGADPSAIIGGINEMWGKNYRNGEGNLFVCEADEYGENFTYYHPKYIIINNVEMEHPEFFLNLEDYKDNYCNFLKNIKENGIIVFNADDTNIIDIINKSYENLKNKNIKLLSYTINNDYIGLSHNYKVKFNSRYFSINNEKFALINSLKGEHNIRNTIISMILLKELGFESNILKDALKVCKGAKRRMEKVMNNNKLVVYDDYAHHHTQVYSNLLTLKNCITNKEKIIAILEPHLISRFTNNSEAYIKAMEIADYPIITKFFKSREFDLDEPVMDQYLNNTKVKYISDFNDVVKNVMEIIKNDKGNFKKYHIVVMGAGLSYKLTNMIVKNLNSKNHPNRK